MDRITQLLWTRTTRWTLISTNLKLNTHLQAFSWGFGGYGRLGHSETADELVRRYSGLLSFSTKFRIGFVIINLKGATSYQVPRWKEPRREGSYLWLCIQPWHLGDPGDGEHVGHLHD